jgi:uncharacterized protein
LKYSSHSLKKSAKVVLAAYLIITILAIIPLLNIRFDYDFEKFFPKNDSSFQYYQNFLKKFGKDNNVLLLALENESGIFDKDFLLKVNTLTDSIKKIKHVESVLSPVQMKFPIISAFGFTEVPYFHINNPDLYFDDSVRIFKEPLLVNNLIAKNGKSLCLVIQSDSGISKPTEDNIIYKLNSHINSFHFDKHYLAGRVISQTLLVEKMQWELVIFMSASALLVVIFLIVAFRSVWGVVVPVLVVLLSTLYLVSLMVLLGKPLDILTILLPTILFVVGMSDVVHIWSKYLQELRLGLSKIESLKNTLNEVGRATFLTSVTTAIGFLSLLTANISPVKDLGVYTAIGVFIAFFVAFTLLPATLYLMPIPKLQQTQKYNKAWNSVLMFLFFYVFRNQKKIVISFIILVLLSFYGISQIKINAKILDDIPETDRIKKDLKFLENNYAGIRPFEMVISITDTSKSVFDYEVMIEIDKIEKYLSSNYGLRYVISPLTMVKSLNKALNGGVIDYFKLPTEKEMSKINSKIKMVRHRQEFKSMVSESTKELRLTGRMDDMGSFLVGKKNEELERFLNENINQKIITTRLTGSALLIDKNNEYLSANLLQGLGIGFVFIGIIVWFMFKNLKTVFIFFVPNIIPLVFIGGIMGLTGIDLKVSTSIIFTIAFGIAVDDTIHFLSKLKIELNKGKTMLVAIKNTFLSTGKAIVITSIILSGGFLTLLLSDFGGTFYTGLLVGLTLIFALIADLFLLPVLLMSGSKKIR